MMRPAHTSIAMIGAFALALALAFGGGRESLANGDGYQVIVNPDFQVDELERDFVRDVYLKKATDWAGRAVHPIQLTSRHAASEQFVRDVIRKTPAQLKKYWSQQIFSGKGVPPPDVDSPAAVVAYVVERPGAIGYIPKNVDPGRARVVRLK